MNRLSTPVSTLAALLVASLGLSSVAAATIDWTTSTVAGVADVRTTGTLVGAMNVGGFNTRTINGVAFVADTTASAGPLALGSATVSFGNLASTFNDFWAPADPDVDATYAAALDTGRWGASGPGTVTLGGLTVGRKYLVQLWIADTRAGGDTRIRTVDGVATTSGGPNIATGTFVADAVTQVITVDDGANTFGPQVNLLQLREVLHVTTTADSGAGSLRQALADAATLSGADTITFAAALSGRTITLGSEIVVNGAGGVTVDATALAGGLTVNGGAGGNRIFSISSGPVTLAGLNLTGGDGGGATSAGLGGAILNRGTLTLTRCTLSGNSTAEGSGGAIYSTGSLTLTQCTVSGNNAGSWGGGLYNSGSAHLLHCTVANNHAGDRGGGLYNASSLTLENSLVAGNSAGFLADIFNGDTLTLVGANLVQTAVSGGITGTGEITVADPLLAALAANNGPTPTHATSPASRARNTAVGSAITADQRGYPLFGAADIGAYEGQLGPIAAVIVNEDAPTTGALSFNVGTVGTLAATSSNIALVPNDNLVLDGSGGSRTLTATPLANANGTAILTVRDTVSGETTACVLTVTAVNDAPTATRLNFDQTYTEDSPLDLTDIVITDVDSANVSATLMLSEPAAGSLSTATAGTTTSAYDAGTGLWTTTGPVAEVNTLLAGVTFIPAANYNANFAISTRVSDGVAPALTGSKTLTGTPVNDAPSFTKGADQTLGAGTTTAQSVPGWATAISDGDGNVQALTFTVTETGSSGLFTVAPAVAADGTLTYTPNGTAGTASLSVALTDDATQGGAALATAPQTFTISVVLDYAVTTSGGVLTVTELTGANNTLTLTQPSEGNVQFNATNRTFSVNGAPALTGDSGSLSLAGITEVVVNAGAGSDTLNVGVADSGNHFTAFPSLTLNGGTGNDAVIFNRDVTFVAGANLDLDLQNDAPSPGVDRVTLASSRQVILSGTGTATVKVSRSIRLNESAGLETGDGALLLEANRQAAPTAADFVGIFISGTVRATGAGSVTLHGTGGAGTDRLSDGIVVQGTITSAGGPVTVTGQGGGSGTTASCRGIFLGGPSVIGTEGSGEVNLHGTGGAGSGSNNIGITCTQDVTLFGGSVTLTGIGRAINGPGLRLFSGGLTTVPRGGSLTLVSDQMEFLDGTISTRLTDSVTLRPLTTGRLIDLGSTEDTTTNTLGLSDAELDKITTGTLVIGDANSGLITVSAALSPANYQVLALGQNTTFAANGQFNADLGPTAADSERLTVAGTVTLNATAQLNLTATGGYVPRPGDSFTLLVNDGSDAITGTFTGQPEGTVLAGFLGSGSPAVLTYAGGTGNDLIVTVLNSPPTASNLSAPEIYTEDSPLDLTDIVIADTDSAHVTATLTLSDPAAGSLSIATSGSVTSTYVAGTGVWTATGAVASVNALLAGVTFTPATNDNGSFHLFTSVSDDATPPVTGTKAITGTAVDDPPTLDPLNPLVLASNAGPQTVNLAGIGSGAANETQTLRITATSDNTALIPNPTVTYTSPEATGSLSFTPAAGQTGFALVTVTVSDDTASTSRTFYVSVPVNPDSHVTHPGDNGPGSLRAAIAAAIARTGSQSITFDPALSGKTITLGSEISIGFTSSSILIDATGLLGGLTIDGGPGSNRIFHLPSGARATLRGLTLTGGNGTGADSDLGGAIFSGGILTLTRCTLSGNSAGRGGAIINESGTLELMHCTLSGNSAAGAARGGAILSTSGFLTLTHCTLSGNSAESGGAIYIQGSTLTLTHCTLSGNSAGHAGRGGAIYSEFGTLRLTSSLIAKNTAFSGPDIRLEGGPTVIRSGVNLIGNNNGAVSSFPDGSPNANGDYVGTSAAPLDPLLDALASNGGPTQTHRLLPGSPAINKITTPLSTTDQRGFPMVGAADIGAYESGGLGLAPIAPFSMAEDAPASLTVTLVNPDALSLPGFTGTGTADNASLLPPGSITTTGSDANRTVTLTPAPDQTGTATVTLNFTDGTTSAIASFLVIVSAADDAPTDLNLSATSVPENQPAETAVGTLSGTDPDPGQSATLTFSLVAGAGDTDNARFTVSGTELRTADSFDFEARSTYSIRLRATDTTGLSYEEAVTIHVADLNDLPRFTKGADQALVTGTTAAQTVSGWATAISDGDGGVQALTFTVTETGSSGLFTVPPAVAADGTLTYAPNGTAGVATFSVMLTDDASLTGPALSTAPQTFTIAVSPDYTVTTTGGVLTVTDHTHHGNILTLSQPSAGNLQFAASSRTFSVDGGPALTGNSGSLSLAGITEVVVNAGAGNDTLNVGVAGSGNHFTAFPSLTLNGGPGDDTVNFNRDVTFVSGANLDVDLQNDAPAPGVDQVSLNNSRQVILSGPGTATVKVSRSIRLQDFALLETADGALLLEANRQAVPTPADFDGIFVSSSGTVRSIGTGTVTVRGTGGAGNGDGNNGIEWYGSLTSAGGDMLIIGQGGGSGSSKFGNGLNLGGAQINAGGAGTLTLEGTGGAGTGEVNLGIVCCGTLTSGGGNVTLTGIAGTDASSGGLFVTSGSLTTAANGGTVTLVSDRMNLSGGTISTRLTDRVTLRPLTAGHLIDLGSISDSAANTLGLSDAELDRITTGTLVIGDANSGPITVSAALSPANYKVLALGQNTTFAANGRFNADIGPTAADHERLTVAGTVTLNVNAQLNLSATGGYVPRGGDTFTLLANNGSDAITGTFTGKPDGFTAANFLGSGLVGLFSYLGGDGNDLVVTVPLPPNAPPVAGADTLSRPATTRVAKALKSTLLANDTDADRDPLTITAVGNALPAGATVQMLGNFVVYTAPTADAGNGSFTYTLSDGPGGHTVTGTVTITEGDPASNAGPNVAHVRAHGSDRVLTFIGVPGRTYRVQYTTGASPPYTWLDFSPQGRHTAAPNGVLTHTDVAPSDPMRFYRVVGE